VAGTSKMTTIQWLKDQGFEGFIRFDQIDDQEVTTEHGVYAVVREGTDKPRFVLPGTGRKGSSYTLEVLEAVWVYDAEILYFGKAECRLGILERLTKYRRFGNGKRSGHSGGRAIWQLEDAHNLRVCWRVTGDQNADDEESKLIEAFKEAHRGSRPFANRIDGKKNHR
jgi:hypothetical protein